MIGITIMLSEELYEMLRARAQANQRPAYREAEIIVERGLLGDTVAGELVRRIRDAQERVRRRSDEMRSALARPEGKFKL